MTKKQAVLNVPEGFYAERDFVDFYLKLANKYHGTPSDWENGKCNTKKSSCQIQIGCIETMLKLNIMEAASSIHTPTITLKQILLCKVDTRLVIRDERSDKEENHNFSMFGLFGPQLSNNYRQFKTLPSLERNLEPAYIREINSH